jgi:F-type H+-transporting ATPase subunit b
LKRSPKIRLKICAAVLMLAGLFAPVARLHAQTPVQDRTSKAEKVDAPETNKELEAFRHAPAVQSLANHFHVSVEFMAKLLEDLNSAILIGAILWFLLRMVPIMYRRRTETLQKQLFDARLATTEANEKLAAIEERLSKLGVEIDAIRQQTERDSATDEKRIHDTLEAEKQRLVSSVEQEIEAAGAAARRDLKTYAATLAVERAMAEIRLTDEDDRILVRSFGKDLSGERN